MAAHVVDMEVPIGAVLGLCCIEPFKPGREVAIGNQQNDVRRAAAERHVRRGGSFQELTVPGLIDVPVFLALRQGVGARDRTENGERAVRGLPAYLAFLDEYATEMLLDSFGNGVVETHRT